jgi:hypothetical protein
MAKRILTSLTQSCSFSFSKTCSPMRVRIKKASLITMTLFASLSDSAWFSARFASEPSPQVKSTIRQSSLKSFLTRFVASGIKTKLKIVAGKKVAKNVRLTALKESNKLLLRQTLLQANMEASTYKCRSNLTASNRII